MIRRVLLFLLLFTVAAQCEEAPKLKVADADALAIRDVQVQYLLTLQQLKDLEQQRKQQFVVLQQKMAAAYAHAKLDPADFDLDDQKWEFIAKSKPKTSPGAAVINKPVAEPAKKPKK